MAGARTARIVGPCKARLRDVPFAVRVRSEGLETYFIGRHRLRETG